MDLVASIQQRISGRKEVLFAFLFGSCVRGTAHPGSDIDLALYLDEDLSVRQRFEIRRQLMTDLSDLGRIDVVDLNSAPPLLGHRALLGRRVLIQDGRSYVRYFVRTLAAVLDEQPWRELHHTERRIRVMEGRFGRP